MGRYLRPDPIGLLGGLNLCAYVENNPVNWIDLYGLDVIITIRRGISTNMSTPGEISVTSTSYVGGFEGYTLEPPSFGKYPRMAPGSYSAYQRFRSVKGEEIYDPPRIHLENVIDEKGDPMPGAQIHNGSFPVDTKGCILVGAYPDLDFVGLSKASMEAINAIIDADGGKIIVKIEYYKPEEDACE